MSGKYVVAVDGSESGWKALDMAAKQALAAEADLLVVHVVRFEPVPDAIVAWAETEGLGQGEIDTRFHENRAISDAILYEARRRLREAGMAEARSVAPEGNVAGELIRIAREEKADMVFLGSRGLSDVEGLLLGSVSHKVAHLVPCTCVIVR